MRVAINGLFLDAPATGTGQYLRELVGALRQLAPHDEFVFVAPHADPSAPTPLRVAPPRARQRNLAKLEFEQLTFPRAARSFDVAHVPHFAPPLLPLSPTVITIHDVIPLVMPAYASSRRVRLYNRLVALAARRAPVVLADSEASARDIESHLMLPRAKIRVVYLAANTLFHPPLPTEIARARAKYNLSDEFILYLGGFDVRKNLARVMETFAGLENDQTRLVIAGKLPEQNSAFFPDPRAMAERFGVAARVTFPGFVADEDKPAIYAGARAFLFPSRYEGFGLPPLEAMSCGTPVLAANTASLPEVVGTAGILLHPDDARGWIQALRELLSNEILWNQQRARGLAQASQFSWARAARETLEVYRSLTPTPIRRI